MHICGCCCMACMLTQPPPRMVSLLHSDNKFTIQLFVTIQRKPTYLGNSSESAIAVTCFKQWQQMSTVYSYRLKSITAHCSSEHNRNSTSYDAVDSNQFTINSSVAATKTKLQWQSITLQKQLLHQDCT